MVRVCIRKFKIRGTNHIAPVVFVHFADFGVNQGLKAVPRAIDGEFSATGQPSGGKQNIFDKG